ncbi:N-alpha-acetyltransferase 30 [Asbolus verrucosus]|uniref:N-terminal methionine N(alpha)-acetyltransferase NatC n=1 Tax=Asbolus verrucosus TaxID=1661398 RepID=A0A482W9C0_ASBVE|nr:N-alpha-acetyltransferase 30 [Asbolus verrucosus]
MNKNSNKINKTKKCTSTNCEPKNDINEKAKDTILKKKHSKKGNLNGLVNGIVNNAQDPTKGKEKNEKNSIEGHNLKDHIIPSNNENTYKNNKSKPQKEISREKKSEEEGISKELKSKLTKLDSNDNISSHAKMLEPSQETDVSYNLSNNSTITFEDSIASCSNKITSSSDEKISDLVEDLEKVEIEQPKRELPPIKYVQYESELQMPMIMKIIQKDLSEPYSIYTYRYFIHNWPKLCFLAMCEDNCVGAIVCKLDIHRKVIKRGYIAMLAVDQNYRKLGIGSTLVRRAIQEMIVGDADEVVLETEVTNKPALQLYEALGFVRDKRLFRYYLNGVDALRLKLWLR